MYPCRGIIIAKQNKRESDQLLTVFTQEYGKLNLLCKGVRKSKAKLSGHTGLFYFSNLNFVLGKQYKILTSAIEIESFSNVKKEMEKARAAKHISLLIDQYTIIEEKDENIFHLVLGALDYLNKKEMKSIDIKLFLRYFEFKFLSLLGYEPEDKTILYAFTNTPATLPETTLDEIEKQFTKQFQCIYG